MPRTPSSDSDSDTEADKLKRQQMRESVEENQFAYKKPEPVVIVTPAAAVAAAGSAENIAAAAAASSNPFYTLLHPPVPPFFTMPIVPVAEHLKANPLRVGFLTRVEAQITATRQQLERRRRNGLHGLTSNRCGGDDDDLAASGPRVLNAFEQSMLKNLGATLARNLEVLDEAWPEESEEQREKRAAGELAQKEFQVMTRFPPGTFLAPSFDLVGSTSFPSPAEAAAAAAAAPAPIDEEAAKRQRKLERKAQKVAAAGGDPNAVETPEQRRIRKEAKREKRKAIEAAGGDAVKKAKKPKSEPAAQA